MKILILDFGSQYTYLIKTTYKKHGIHTEILPADVNLNNIKKQDYGGIILSGSASSIHKKIIKFDNRVLDIDLPILGICYGHQLIAHLYGGKVANVQQEFGKTNFRILKHDPLFSNIKEQFQVWMSHNESVIRLPKNSNHLGESTYNKFAAFKIGNNIQALQFHPEVSHTEYGEQILMNFAIKLCNIQAGVKWTPSNFQQKYKDSFNNELKDRKFILALSGGVDSLTLAAFMRLFAHKKDFKAIYVDTGLMPDSTELEVKNFCKKYDINLKTISAKKRFLKRLRGIKDPREKGRVIGYEFISIFEEEAKKFNTNILLQGTILSDIIESGVSKFSSQIKPHHNVACIPNNTKLQIIEPFKDLFKNEIREIAKSINLDSNIINKKVFPGPGFAIRIQNEVSEDKLKIVKNATKIIEETIVSHHLSDKIWMAFAVLIEAPSLGIKGDKRIWSKYAIVIRIVESTNSMTANFSREAMSLLPEISQRIVDEVGISRVLYDISDKPPSTIEWQ